jgi:hypothetical protein
MKATGQFEKWATGFLAVVCLVLVLNLVLRSGTKLGTPRPAVKAASTSPTHGSQGGSAVVVDQLSAYNPEVHLALLKELDSRPLPKLERNPYEFPPPPAKKPQPGSAESSSPAAPPPPALPAVKALGYSQKADGVREAVVLDGDEVRLVREGDSIAGRLRVLRISPTQVEVEDETTRQTVRLPIPQ